MKDNTPEFLELMDKVAQQSTHFGGYHVMAPLITYDKDMVVKLGAELGVPWEYTYSCYSGSGFTEVGGRRLPLHCGLRPGGGCGPLCLRRLTLVLGFAGILCDPEAPA